MPDSKLPDCLLIGAAKSGTTSLAFYLSQSAEVEVAKGKEAHFFDIDERYSRGLGYYKQQFFGGADPLKKWVDATPGYMHVYSKTIGRIKEVYGSEIPKFIVVLRDPVQRAWSHYLHRHRNSQEPLSFEEAILKEEERIQQDPAEWWRYYTDSLYAQQLREWFAAFGAEHFLIIKQSDLLDDPVGKTNEALQFIGCLNPITKLNVEKKNTASTPRFKWFNRLLNMPWPIPLVIKRRILKETGPRIRQRLRKLNQTRTEFKKNVPSPDQELLDRLRTQFLEDIELLEKLTGQSFDEWK